MSLPDQTKIHLDEYCDSLDVTCHHRIQNTNLAIQQVENILSKLESCEFLFPSSRQLVLANPSWGDQAFQTRVKVLCMWFNLTIQLNKKIEILGQILIGISSRHKLSIPWPDLSFKPETSEEPASREQASCGDIPDVISAPAPASSSTPTPTQLHPSPVKVRFKMCNEVITSSPSDSNNSTDSGAGSATDFKLQPLRQDSAISTQSGHSISSHMSDSYFGEISPYRRYVEKLLKTRGIRKILQGLHKIIRGTLHRAKTALEPPQGLEDPGAAPAYQPYHPHLEERCSSLPCPSEDDLDLSGFGCWNPEFASMNLPSFRATYLFLCRVPRDIMHECLIIRLEQKPLEPSELSIRQLMRECKEALKLAVGERQKYISRVKAGIHDVELDKSFLENFDREMQEYDEHLTETLDVYLEYLRNFVTMIQGDSSLLISTYQKNLLEQEWDFIKSTCPHVPGGEARAGNTFCQMARGMLSAIEDFLQSGIDETMKNMYVLADSFTEDDEVELDTQTRKRLLEAFRGFQTLFSEARERSVKAISFAKLLRKDLEVSAEFSMSRSTEDVLNRLHHTGHVQVIAPHSRQHLIFIPNSIKNKEDHILQLLDMHCGQDTTNQDINHGYLVLMEHGISDVPLWHGETKFVKPTAETTISLSQIEVSGVLLVAPSAVLLEVRRKEFSKSMQDVLIPGQEQRATSQAIADSLDDVKQGALSLRSKICQELSSVEEKCDTSSLESLEPMDRDTLVRRMREILQQCYKFGFEYHKELDRLITGDNSRRDLAVGTIQFSMQWMRFVLAWCERGRGLRPDWAVKGMEFLYLAASPTYTRYLTECEFLDFKNLTEECHNHVVGDVRDTPERKPSVSPRGDRGSRPYSRSGSRCASPHRSMSREDQLHRKLNEIDPDRIAMPPPQSPISPVPQSPMGTIRRRRSEGRRSLQGDELDASDLSVRVPAFGNLPWRERVKKSIECFESEREEQKHQQQAIGRVLDQTMPEDRIHIKARLVKFSWQRGVKIGQGHFGKVYTAINNETGDIMAMKEIPLQPNDHKTLKSVADELRIFESIHHPNLVNHFGVEIHREEMLIFMEYCPEGTLEALCSSTEAGLEESLVRRYTGQLLQAVACLHENGIVHRDIKGANIFLTDDMRNLKLGDFGCAVKIKAHTTMPGELQGFVGTQAFMAPEVFTRNMSEGHGRSADIWSLGCVVIEMVTGLRPWAELESNYQIMFKVGMGQTPGIPSTLSDEGKNFLARCFVHDPLKRDTAEDLINHHFTKIYEDDDVASMPLFASVSDMSEMRKSLVRKDSGKY
ncbi:mitogen-activated protein kinase kinase kinase 4 isoform X2 [Eurytemora carolleeae]|uniref:mitogen-activated protein kinase kinase kinase 4 isoform X2 n=1 Tax=Eurytemora carolleeae TaxID=1294199 RepID=UPI000C76924C|nr:mitogen-activated protein kinase kinase kinase 4 isoform X2 [Eurytemora carolleeae]|eukprot:XP_023342644.1 mitogen-activated protein kinase kinase kinase 4-like isoform X2 [Eurytemora affinis]